MRECGEGGESCKEKQKSPLGQQGGWPKAQCGENLTGKGFCPVGSPTMHQVPSADKNGLCSLEVRDRNRQETCLFLRSVRGNSHLVRTRPIDKREAGKAQGLFFLPIKNFFVVVLFYVPFLLEETENVTPTSQGRMATCGYLKKMATMNPEIPTLKPQVWFYLGREIVGDFYFFYTLCGILQIFLP